MSAATEKRTRTGVRRLSGAELWDVAKKDLPLTRPEIAKVLGVCPDTISDYVKQGMPAIGNKAGKKGARARFILSDCEDWLRYRYDREQ